MKRLPLMLLAGMFVLGMDVLLPLTSPAANLYTFRDENGVIHFTNVPSLGRSKYRQALTRVRMKDKWTIPQVSGTVSAGDRNYNDVILSTCRQFAVDPHLVRAVIKAESNFDPGAVSHKGAMGLMQLMPDTAREMGVANPFDPVENIRGGVGYLSQLLNSLKGNVPLALAAYNAGPQRVMSYNGIPPFQETRNYVQRVLSYYQLFKGAGEL